MRNSCAELANRSCRFSKYSAIRSSNRLNARESLIDFIFPCVTDGQTFFHLLRAQAIPKCESCLARGALRAAPANNLPKGPRPAPPEYSTTSSVRRVGRMLNGTHRSPNANSHRSTPRISHCTFHHPILVHRGRHSIGQFKLSSALETSMADQSGTLKVCPYHARPRLLDLCCHWRIDHYLFRVNSLAACRLGVTGWPGTHQPYIDLGQLLC